MARKWAQCTARSRVDCGQRRKHGKRSRWDQRREALDRTIKPQTDHPSLLQCRAGPWSAPTWASTKVEPYPEEKASDFVMSCGVSPLTRDSRGSSDVLRASALSLTSLSFSFVSVA